MKKKTEKPGLQRTSREFTPEAKKKFVAEDAYATLRANRGAIAEMAATKGWAIWQEWAETQMQIWRNAAVDLENPLERDNARHRALALKELRAIVFVLADVETALKDPAPAPQKASSGQQ